MGGVYHYLNNHAHDTLDNFLIPVIEICFGEYKIIFQDDNTSCHKAERVKDCLWQQHWKSMTASEQFRYLNLVLKNGP